MAGTGVAGAMPMEEVRESLLTQGQRVMQLGQEKDALAYAYGSAIAEETTEVLDKYRWVEAFKRPILAVRWGIGVQLTVSPKNFEGSYYPVGSTQNIPDRPSRSRRGGGQNQPRGSSGGPTMPGGSGGPPGIMPGGVGGPPGMMPGGMMPGGMMSGYPGMGGMSGGAAARTGTSELLTRTVGELGDELVKRLRDKIEGGEYGPLLVDLSIVPPPPSMLRPGTGAMAGGMSSGMMGSMMSGMAGMPGVAGMATGTATPPGMTGPPGMPMGSPGPPGMTGPPGMPMSSPGPPGMMGAPGMTGPPGMTMSSPGPPGMTGAPGMTGPPAMMGAPGMTGPPGMTMSSPGPPGMMGAPGMTGPPAMMGAPGMTGPPGMMAASGMMRPSGPTVPAGMAGTMGPPGMMTSGRGPAGMGGGAAVTGTVNPDSLMNGVTMLGKGDTKDLLKKAAEQGIDVLAVFEVDVEENTKTRFVTNKTRLVVWDVAKGEELVKSTTFQNIQIQKLRAEEQEEEDPVTSGFDKLFAVLDTDPAKAIKVRDVPAELKREHVEGRIASLLSNSQADKLAVLAEIKYFSHRGLISDGLLAKSFQQLLGDDDGLKLAKGTEEERLEVLATLLPHEAD